MAKNSTIILLAGILAFSWSCNFHQPDLKLSGTPQPNPELTPDLTPYLSPREKVVNTAIAEIGVQEEGGNNRGKRIGEYLASTGLKQGHPWCAAFVKWVYDENNIPTPGATAWSPSWFPKPKTYWHKGDDPSSIQAGDIFGLHYTNLGRIGHAGLVEKEEGGWLYTIEGNTGDDQGRDGDVVRKHRRSIKTVTKISNFIEP